MISLFVGTGGSPGKAGEAQTSHAGEHTRGQYTTCLSGLPVSDRRLRLDMILELARLLWNLDLINYPDIRFSWFS